jgi:hypothetical protein
MDKHAFYVACTDDELELPIAVADTVTELADLVGVTRSSIYSMMSRKQGHYYKITEADE